jgi:hypothetical protein
MDTFKKFYTDKTGDSFTKYNVVLFVGEYNPITYDEYDRIRQFVDTVIKGPEHTKMFEDSVDIGIIMNADKDEEKFSVQKQYNLSFEERNYITTKIFGLKAISIDLKQLEMAQQLSKVGDVEKLNELLFKVSEDMKKVFHKSNILIVLRDKDNIIKDGFQHIKGTYETDLNTESKVDLVIFKHKQHVPKSISMPCDGQIIKAITLLNADKPLPENLRAFAAKYGLLDYIDEIRRIHFKTGGERYHLAFELVFPQMNLFAGQDEASKQANILFIMDLLKEMYLKISV